MVTVLKAAWKTQPATRSEWCKIREINPKKKKTKGKLHQMEFLGGNSGASMVCVESGTAGWSGNFGV